MIRKLLLLAVVSVVSILRCFGAESAISVAPASAAMSAADISAAAAASGERRTQVFEGVRVEYPAELEPLARGLAKMVGELRGQRAGQRKSEAAAAAIGPLTLHDFRQNRADYLARCAAIIGLEKPTALQEECYDGSASSKKRRAP